jgi:hypothetical protein
VDLPIGNILAMGLGRNMNKPTLSRHGVISRCRMRLKEVWRKYVQAYKIGENISNVRIKNPHRVPRILYFIPRNRPAYRLWIMDSSTSLTGHTPHKTPFLSGQHNLSIRFGVLATPAGGEYEQHGHRCSPQREHSKERPTLS